MKVAININDLGLGQRRKIFPTEIFRYVDNLLNLLKDHPFLTPLFFVNDPTENLLDARQYLVSNNMVSNTFFPQWEHYQKSKTLCSIDPIAIKDVSLIHFPSTCFIPPEELHLKPFQRTIYTVHDTLCYLYPEFYDSNTLKSSIAYLKQLNRNSWILCPSGSAKYTICNYCDIDPDRVIINSYAACTKTFYPCSDQSIFNSLKTKYKIGDTPYLLCVGRLEDRKNTHHIIRSFIHLIEQEKIHDLNLIFCGAITPPSDSIFHTYNQYILERGYQDRVTHIPFIENKYLATIYSNALASVFLPIYEDFGLPALEAMQCATPLITAHNSSIPEVVGDAGIMIDNNDQDAFAQKVLSLYHSDKLRQSYIKKGLERAKLFSRDKHFRKLLHTYQQALNA